MLIDTGFEVNDRDAKRIYSATEQAGLKKTDYLVISPLPRRPCGRAFRAFQDDPDRQVFWSRG